MAKAMVRRAIAEKIPLGWVTADAAYGYSKGRRHELEQADVCHVMATTRHDTVVTRRAIDHAVHGLFPGLPRQKWKRRPYGNGAHGPRVFDRPRSSIEHVCTGPTGAGADNTRPHQPLRTTRPRTTRDRPTITQKTVALLGRDGLGDLPAPAPRCSPEHMVNRATR